MEEKEEISVFRSALKPGVILGISFILFLFTLYIVDAKYLANPWIPVILLIGIIVAIIIIGVKFRKDNGGYLSYGKALLFCIVTFAIATLMSNLYNIVLFEVVDTELVTYVGDIMVENTVERMRNFGQTETVIEARYDQIKEDTYASLTAPKFLQRYFILLIVYSVITLLTALIVKKSKPIEDVY